jgi:hypothetical protein
MDGYLLSRDLVERALDLCSPQVELLIKHYKRVGGSIAVGWRGRMGDEDNPVLAKRDYGDKRHWNHPYRDIAGSKLHLTTSSGLPSCYVQNCAPQFLDDDDTAFWGSAIIDNVCAAFSGLPPEVDEAIAYMVAAMVIALVKLERKALVEKMGPSSSFLNGD